MVQGKTQELGINILWIGNLIIEMKLIYHLERLIDRPLTVFKSSQLNLSIVIVSNNNKFSNKNLAYKNRTAGRTEFWLKEKAWETKINNSNERGRD